MPARDDRPSGAGAGAGSNRQGGIPDGLLLALLAFLLGLTILVWTSTGLAGLFSHGGWPDGVTFGRTPLALRELVTKPHDVAGAWPATPPAQLSGYGLFWGLLISQLMVLTVLTVFAMGVLTRWRLVRKRRKQYPEYPQYPEYAGDPAAGAGGGQGTGVERQTPPAPVPAPVPTQAPPQPPVQPMPVQPTSVQPTSVQPMPVQEQHVQQQPPAAEPERIVIAAVPAAVPAPRAAPQVRYGDRHTRRPAAIQAIRDAEGPALVITSDPTVWAESKDARAKLGPVLVYDPGHLCDTPARLHWSPTAGCTDATTAAARAAALLAPVRPRALIDAAMADTAETLLRCWLHAAAVDGRPFKQVHRWAQGGSAQEAVRILRTHAKAASGLAGLLESAYTAHPQRREIAQQLTARALSSLSSIHIRETCTPNRTDSLTLESFVAEGGTLYVVGEPIEDPRSRPGAMPLLTALSSSVVEHGRRMAARSSDGRLDPPLTLVLDDVAAVAPLPFLPELLATGRSQGLPTLALLRSREQGRDRWPDHELPYEEPLHEAPLRPSPPV